MKLLSEIFRLLNRRQKYLLFAATFFRVSAVGLEIVGLALIGISVGLLTNSEFSESSLTGIILGFLKSFSGLNPIILVASLAFVFFTVKALALVLVNFWVAKSLAMLEVQRTQVVFEQVLSSRLESIENYTARQIAHGLNGSASVAFSNVFNSVSSLIGETFLFLALIAYMMSLDFFTTAALLAYFLAVLLILQSIIGPKLKSLARSSDDASVGTNALVLDLLENFRQLRSDFAKEAFKSRFFDIRKQLAFSRGLAGTLSLTPRFIAEIALVGGMLFIVVVQLQFQGRIEATSLSILVVGSLRLVGSLVASQGILNSVFQFQEQAKWVMELSRLDRPKANLWSPENSNLNPPEIRADQLSYRYPDGKSVLQGIDFELKPGTLMLVRGKSGSGKSTLADLIMGLRVPTSGSLSVDGFSPEEYAEQYPNSIAYVPQQTRLIEGSLLQNILLTPIAANYHQLDHVYKAIEMSGLEFLVDSLRGDLSTRIGLGAHGLSGGQIQRIGLARALVHRPNLLVLDEVTSALDFETASEITQTINGLRGDITLIVISHKPETSLKFDLEFRLPSL